MRDLLISLNSNTLKLTYCGPEGCGGITSEISPEIASDSEVLDAEAFTQKLVELSSEILPKKRKPEGIHFLAGPGDIHLAFITVEKNGKPTEEQIIEGIKSKIEVPLEDLYFSYSKIAPFVYQFVAIEKEKMERLLEVSTLWGVPVKSVVPWVSLLPKTLKSTEPAIFLAEVGENQVVALSELNGIYFAETYEESRETSELEALVRTLSVYKRKKPIDKIYTLNTGFSVGTDYTVLPMLSDEEGRLLPEGFEEHELFLKVVSENSDLLQTQVNLLNLLPLPEPSKVSGALVPAGVFMLVLSLLVGGYFLFFEGGASEVPLGAGQEVLSEVSETTASTPSEEEVSAQAGVEVAEDLNKEDLSVRIENGAGINGAAGRTQALLEEAGYTVDSIDTADNMYETTQILISEEMTEYRDILKEDLGEDYPEAVVDVLEDSDADYDALIILGKNTTI